MGRKYDRIILEHYDNEAMTHGLDSTSTMLDATVRERETHLIERFVTLAVASLRRQGIHDNRIAICDVGCGNGSTLEVLWRKFPKVGYQGIEFTPSMLKLAQTRCRGVRNVEVSHGDVRDLKGYKRRFNIVLCQRVIINVLDPVDQQAALGELASIIEDGGYLLSIEAFWEPLANLNAARFEFGQPPLDPSHHNRYLSPDFYSSETSLIPLDGPMLDEGLPIDFLPCNFLSSHYFVSRVIHPLALGPERPFERNSHFVQFLTKAFDRPIGDYSPVKAYAFKKQTSGSAQTT
jgi:SAM-dependent methyltransferase